MKVRSCSISTISRQFEISSSNIFGKVSPGIGKQSDGGFYIRILRGQSSNMYGERKTSWDYFYTDKDGVVIQAPRGFSKQYKGAKITDIAEAQKQFEEEIK